MRGVFYSWGVVEVVVVNATTTISDLVFVHVRPQNEYAKSGGWWQRFGLEHLKLPVHDSGCNRLSVISQGQARHSTKDPLPVYWDLCLTPPLTFLALSHATKTQSCYKRRVIPVQPRRRSSVPTWIDRANPIEW
jgi:hypothetical protein